MLPSLASLAKTANLSPHPISIACSAASPVLPRAPMPSAHPANSRANPPLPAGAPVTEAFYAAGFNASSRFYEAAPAMLGMTPTHYRAGGQGETIRYADRSFHASECSAGRGCTEQGICAILLGDEGEDHSAVRPARPFSPKSGPSLPPIPDFADLASSEVVALVDSRRDRLAPTFRLDIRGTAFQRRVWELLRAIPAGSDSDIQRHRQPGSAFAFGGARPWQGACAANTLAVAIPCHRVIAPGLEALRRLPLGCGAQTRVAYARERCVMLPAYRERSPPPSIAPATPRHRAAAHDAGRLRNPWSTSYREASLFRKRITMASHGYGRGEYQYFAYPLPRAHSDFTRPGLYAKLAPIANRWSEMLNLTTRYPDDNTTCLRRPVPQRRSSSGQRHCFCAYEAGDFNCLHQDLYGDAAFSLSRPSSC